MDPECCICYLTWGDENRPMRLNPCGHTVCSDCVEKIRDKRCAMCRAEFVSYEMNTREEFEDIQYRLPCGRQVTIGTKDVVHVCGREEEQLLMNNEQVSGATNLCPLAIMTAFERDCAHALSPMIIRGLCLDPFVEVVIRHGSYDTLELMCKRDMACVGKVRDRIIDDGCTSEERRRLLDMVMCVWDHRLTESKNREKMISSRLRTSQAQARQLEGVRHVGIVSGHPRTTTMLYNSLEEDDGFQLPPPDIVADEDSGDDFGAMDSTADY